MAKEVAAQEKVYSGGEVAKKEKYVRETTCFFVVVVFFSSFFDDAVISRRAWVVLCAGCVLSCLVDFFVRAYPCADDYGGTVELVCAKDEQRLAEPARFFYCAAFFGEKKNCRAVSGVRSPLRRPHGELLVTHAPLVSPGGVWGGSDRRFRGLDLETTQCGRS